MVHENKEQTMNTNEHAIKHVKPSRGNCCRFCRWWAWEEVGNSPYRAENAHCHGAVPPWPITARDDWCRHFSQMIPHLLIVVKCDRCNEEWDEFPPVNGIDEIAVRAAVDSFDGAICKCGLRAESIHYEVFWEIAGALED